MLKVKREKMKKLQKKGKKIDDFFKIRRSEICNSHDQKE